MSEEFDKIELNYYNELYNRLEKAKNFTGQIAGRHSDLFSGHEMRWMVRGFMEGYQRALENLYTEEQVKQAMIEFQDWSCGISIDFFKENYQSEMNEILKQIKQESDEQV